MSTGTFVHIGAPKTGSTLLQKVLFENRGALESLGFVYPDVSLRGFGHHDLAFLISGGYPAWATPQPLPLAALEPPLAAVFRRPETVVVSSENFYLFPQPEALFALLQRTGAMRRGSVTIVVYVRRQDDAHESWYNQTIKAQGYAHDAESCVAAFDELWDYEIQLSRWAAVFGEENLIVRSYEPGRFVGESLVSDFFEILGVALDALVVTEERVNTGLNHDVLEFARLLNGLPLDVQTKRAYHRELIALSARTAGSGLFDEAPALDAAQRRAIRERYTAGNRAVARRYQHRDDLFSAETAEEAAPAPERTGLSVEALTRIVGWLLLRSKQ